MTVIVKKLFNALKTTPLTSVESECAFSTSRNFVTKIRSSLNDDTIHALLFLKKYHREQENALEESRNGQIVSFSSPGSICCNKLKLNSTRNLIPKNSTRFNPFFGSVGSTQPV